MTDAPAPFLTGEWSTLQYAWDSTSFGLLKECARKYQYTILQGWRKRGESVHLKFGLLFHSALENFDKAKASGFDHDAAVDVALDHVLTSTWERGADGEPSGPWESDLPKKTRETLVRTVLWYLEEYKNDPAKTIILANGAPAVELSFRFDLDYVTPVGSRYMLSGHMDRLVDFGGDTFVMDRKTSGSTIGSYFFNQFDPDNQMTLYTFAGRVVYDMPVSGVIIDAAQVAIGFSSYARGITMRSEGQLDEWLLNTGHWLKLAEHYSASNYWPMNEKSCGNYGGCAFRNVCNKDPRIRQNYLETDFEKRFWNPLETR